MTMDLNTIVKLICLAINITCAICSTYWLVKTSKEFKEVFKEITRVYENEETINNFIDSEGKWTKNENE